MTQTYFSVRLPNTRFCHSRAGDNPSQIVILSEAKDLATEFNESPDVSFLRRQESILNISISNLFRISYFDIRVYAIYASRATSHYNNPYLFTGRRVDILDSGSLKIQYNRNRYYDYYSGRWLTHDPLDYVDGMNLYEYVSSNPEKGIDPWGLKYIRDGTYQLDGPDPDDEPFDGTWNSAPWALKIALRPVLSRLKMAKYGVALTWYGLGWRDASAHLTNYLGMTGNRIDTDYPRILRDSGDARKFFIKELKRAMGAAEELVDNSDPQPKQMTTKGITEHKPGIRDDWNWYLAIHSYDTWGRGIVTKGKRRKSCCYTMIWTLHLSDIYDFDWSEPQMRLLNYCGWAKYFRVKGKHTIYIKWAKGYRLDHDAPMDVVEGRLKPFPQCK